MKLTRIAKLIERAVSGKPSRQIQAVTGEYYQPYYSLFRLLARDLSPGSIIVELGVSKGYGVYSFALGNPKVKVIGLDHNVKPEYMLRNIDFHFVSALPVPDFINKNISILHIDTEHSYTNAKNEFEQYKPYLLPGAVVCFDDLHAMDNGVLKAFYELPYPKIQDDRLHLVNGYGMLIYE
jgi:tRNA G46 methylase TrmB